MCEQEDLLCCTVWFSGIRVAVGWSPTRTLHPFWGNFRVGGDSPGTMDRGFQALNERIGYNALIENPSPQLALLDRYRL